MQEKEDAAGLASRLLSGARQFIWEEEPLPQKRAAVDDKAAAQEIAEPAAADAGTPDRASVAHGMGAELLAVVMNRPTAYSALVEAIAALAHIPMDEATRYRSAFAVLKQTQQRSVPQIMQALNVHGSLLDAEIARFQGQSKTAEDSEITARIDEAAALAAALEQGRRQIEKLRADTQERIRQLQDELEKKESRASALADETEEKKRAIAHTTRNFDAAVEAVKTALAHDKARIAQYLE